MNDNHRTKLPRAAARVVTDTLGEMPVVVVIGARRTGKSTLARHLAGGEAVGAHLETMILSELLVWREISVPRPRMSGFVGCTT